MIIAVENLRALCQSVLMDRGLDEADAQVVTDILIEAELRGRATHGMITCPALSSAFRGAPQCRWSRSKRRGLTR